METGYRFIWQLFSGAGKWQEEFFLETVTGYVDHVIYPVSYTHLRAHET